MIHANKKTARTLLAVLGCALFLSACSNLSGPTPPGADGTTVYQRPSDANAPDPLIDAPSRTTMVCTSVEPITVLRHFNDVLFACPDLGISATINDMRDAGWRVLSSDIGEDKEDESHVGFPVSVKVRKLF